MILQDIKLAIIGLGYVGLPLAVEFGKLRAIVGFDTEARRRVKSAAAAVGSGVQYKMETARPERIIISCRCAFTHVTRPGASASTARGSARSERE